MYDLEPVAQSQSALSREDELSSYNVSGAAETTSHQMFPIVYDSVPNARDASASAIASGLSSKSAAAHPLLMADGNTAMWLIKWFTEVAVSARNRREGAVSPFVHGRVISVLAEMEKPGGVRKAASARFEDCDSQSQKDNAASTLAEINDLINTTLQRLLLGKPSIRREAETERLVQHLYSVTYTLWSNAETLDLQHLQPCDAWRLAESIRRSMLAAIFVRGIWSVMGSGYCHYEPFLESLPFDPRAGLWEAESDENWSTIVGQKYRGVHTQLKSWHEFTEACEQLSVDEDGQFQRMLYVSFHGSDGIRWLEELDLRKYGKAP